MAWNGQISIPQWNGSKQKTSADVIPGLSSLSSIVSYGLSSILNDLNRDFSSLSSIISVDISTLSSLIGNFSTLAQQAVPGISSLSSVVSYGLSTVARQPNNGISSLSTIVGYGLSSLATYSTLTAITFRTSTLIATNVKTSSLQFVDAVGRNLIISSIIQNRSIYTPDEEDSDGLIAFTNRGLDEFYGIITTSDNRSTFSIGGATNLGLLGASTIQMLGIRGIDIKTIRSDADPTAITIDTDALGITANALVAIIPEITLNAGQINTNAYMSTNVIHADLILGNIADFGILNASTITFTDLSAVNITASNITTGFFNVTDNANIANLTANGLTVNDSANYNTYISFGTNNSELYGAQYLYDINSVRNLQVEKITVLGGWTGDDVLPPYYNDSIVEIGEDEIRPGQVIINGFNEDPLDLGIALTVRGDTQITQNLNVLGLTTLEGLVEAVGDFNVDGAFTAQGTVDITGITTATGVVNCLGGLAVEGEANFLGAVTAEAGIGIVGALGLTGGNVTFGSSEDTGYNFNVYYGTIFQNNVDMSKHNINRVDVLTFTNIANDSDYFFQYATFTYPNSNTVETLKFNDCPFLYSSAVSVGQNSILDIRDIQFIDQGNGRYQYMAVFDDEVVLTLFDPSNNYIRSTWVAETWSKFKAIQGVDIDNQDINAVNQLNASTIVTNVIYTAILGQPDPYVPTAIFVNNAFDMGGNTISNVGQMYYGATRQPFIQYGDVSFAGGGTQTVTLPIEYIDSNYVITATYSVDPGSSAKPIHIDSRTTSNFTISAQSGHAAYWVTYGNNN